ncbi:gluconate 2-dehydrogenase subunit 3 family protein [Sphingobacterium spiritivorum]|uniref:gluconate 2-dehydrogenase subunit 3 family protein n=1 Tax=Sphingobacterium spiritivorum TaxID=258 RepID=UPI003DA3356A
MQRRTALKQLFFITGGIVLFPSCWGGANKASIALCKLHINAEQENLLAEIVESIIPETDSPGGRALHLHFFVLKMIDDCHSEEDQQVFVQGLKDWDHEMNNFARKIFLQADSDQRQSYLLEIEKDKAHPLSSFFMMTKRRAIQGYLNSAYVMKNKLIYELVPGRYNGYAKV